MADANGSWQLHRHLQHHASTRKSKRVNKVFLQRTIRSVDDHNRRQQETQCWEQHEAEKRRVSDTIGASSSDVRPMKRQRPVASTSCDISSSMVATASGHGDGPRCEAGAANMVSVDGQGAASFAGGHCGLRIEDERSYWAQRKAVYSLAAAGGLAVRRRALQPAQALALRHRFCTATLRRLDAKPPKRSLEKGLRQRCKRIPRRR